MITVIKMRLAVTITNTGVGLQQMQKHLDICHWNYEKYPIIIDLTINKFHILM
jgi:hypothetical protein